jgi:hypothetical protein
MKLQLLATHRSFLAVLMLAVAICVLPTAAAAKDSNAPKSASDRWLPCDDWVMLHWIPFDEGDFARVSGANPHRVLNWIRDDQHHTLGQLVALKGITLDQATDELTERWSGKVSAERLSILKKRTMDMLTQGHLSQHVLFHHFHDPVIAVHSQEIFGLSRGDYTVARRSGYSPAEMGRHQHRTKRQVKVAALRVMRKYMRVAIASQEISAPEAQRFYRRQVRYANRWLSQRLHHSLKKRKPFPSGKKAHDFDKQNELYCAIFVGKRTDGRDKEDAAASKLIGG